MSVYPRVGERQAPQEANYQGLRQKHEPLGVLSVLPRDAAGHLWLGRLAHHTQRCHACPGDLGAGMMVVRATTGSMGVRVNEAEESHIGGGKEEKRRLRRFT